MELIKLKSRRAQAWGFDLTAGILIFFAGVMVFFVYVMNFSSQGEEAVTTLGYEGKLIGDSLLSEGLPRDWDETDVQTIGILTDGKVDLVKLKKFRDLVVTDDGYEKSKILFNIGNDYYVSFPNPVDVGAGDIITEIGRNNTNPVNRVKTIRVAVIENKIENINILVWN